MSSNRKALENLLYGSNATDTNSTDLNPHSNATNPVRTRLRTSLQNSANITANGTVYQVSSDDKEEVLSFMNDLMDKFNQSLNISLNGACETPKNGTNLFFNPVCYKHEGRGKYTRFSIDSCDNNTRTLPADVLANTYRFCDEPEGTDLSLIAEYSLLATLGLTACIVCLYLGVICSGPRQQEYHEGRTYHRLNNGDEEEKKQAAQAAVRRNTGLL